MSSLRSHSWQLALLPVLLTASFLLPSLHVHSVYEHDHGGHLHQHADIHADFLSGSDHDQRHSQHEDVALGDSAPRGISQSNLSALLARGVNSPLTGLERNPEFLPVDAAVARPRLGLFARILKREHPPPLQQLFLAPNGPRSPPTLV